MRTNATTTHRTEQLTRHAIRTLTRTFFVLALRDIGGRAYILSSGSVVPCRFLFTALALCIAALTTLLRRQRVILSRKEGKRQIDTRKDR